MSFLRTAAWSVVLALWAVPAAGAEALAIVDRAPANCCLAVFSGDAGATCEAFLQTQPGKILAGEPFAPLVAELTKRGTSSAWHLRPIFGFDWSDLATIHDASGLVMFPLADGTLGAAWLFAPGEPPRETPKCLAVAGEYFSKQGFTAAAVERQGVNLTVLKPPADKGSQSARVLFLAASFYGIANSQAAADVLLAVEPGGALRRDATFVKALPKDAAGDAAQPADLNFFVRPIELLELFASAQRIAKEKEPAPAQRNAKQQLTEERTLMHDVEAARRLKLTGIQSVAGRVRFADDGPCEWGATATINIARPYEGALRTLEFRPGELLPMPEWVPANVISAATWRWDFPLAMKGFGNLFDEANEPGPDGMGLFEDMLDGLRDDPEGVQVDLRRDLFERVSPEMQSISDRGHEKSVPPNARRWLYLAGVADMPKVLDTLTRFYQGDERVAHKREGEFDVWTVEPSSSLFVEGESDSLVTVSGLALGQGKLLIATDVELLNLAIAPPQGAPLLKDDAEWTQLWDWIKGRHTEATAFESVIRLASVLEPSYAKALAAKPLSDSATVIERETRKRDPLVVRLWRMLLFGSARDAADFPFASAPAFEQIRGAFARGGIVLSQTDDGWKVQFGALGAADESSQQ